jgi:hypothetical protein
MVGRRPDPPIAKAQFSDKLRSGVGSIIYDGDPGVSYEEWLADMEKFIAVIDTDTRPKLVRLGPASTKTTSAM